VRVSVTVSVRPISIVRVSVRLGLELRLFKG
jgi:hypothetical protein